MKFLLLPVANGILKSITMEHGDAQLSWTIERYRNFNAGYTEFGDINRILAKLPEKTADELFQVYQQMHDDFLDIADDSKLAMRLRKAFKRISELVPYMLIRKQLQMDGDLWVPIDTEDRHQHDTSNLTAFESNDDDTIDEEAIKAQEAFVNRLTYTVDEYFELNVLIIYIKLYFPVLSHFITHIKNAGGDETFLCTTAVSLLSETEMVKEEGWERLERYVKHFWSGKREKEVLNPSVLLKGMSEDLVTTWVLSELVCRKLMPIGVSHKHDNTPDKDRPNFIKGLFHNVDEYVRILTSNPKNEQYRDKTTTGVEADGIDMVSKLESIRVVQEIDSGAIMQMEVYLSDIENILRMVDPTLPRELVDDIYFDKRYHLAINPVRELILPWMFATGYTADRPVQFFVPPELFVYLTDKPKRNLVVVTLALLKHWGFHDLFKLVDSRILDGEQEIVFGALPINVDQVKIIRKLYPYEIESNRVKGESKRNSNYVILTCYEVQDEIMGKPMETAHEKEQFICKVDVQFQLARLLIYMHDNGHLK